MVQDRMELNETNEFCTESKPKTAKSSYRKGLATQEALSRLHEAVEKELQDYEDELRKTEKCLCHANNWFYDSFHHNSAYSTFRWPCILVLVTIAVLLLVCYAKKDDVRYGYLPYDAAFILLLVVVNVCLVTADNRLRHSEVLHKAKSMLRYLENCVQTCRWEVRNYPQLNAPTSPCITLQWTYRDGEKVNIHCPLLVEGDIVVLRPGQIVPANCRAIDRSSVLLELKSGDIYAPSEETVNGSFSAPQIRVPQTAGDYVLLETPYIKSLRLALRMAQNRPLTFFEKDRHIISVYYIEQIFIPILLALMFSVNVLRYIYFWQYVGHWTEMLIILQVAAVIPLLPLTFPLYWALFNAYGMARLTALFNLVKHSQPLDVLLDEFGEVPGSEMSMEIKWSHVKERFCEILLGRDETLYRTANLLHVLGSVTSLCCVDKKGILSWPNPTPEKVFFLKSGYSTGSGGDLCVSSRDSLRDSLLGQAVGEKSYDEGEGPFRMDSASVGTTEQFRSLSVEQPLQHRSGDLLFDHKFLESRVEVLDLTHDNQVPFRVQFDDPKWKYHINSLKPLGLTILLNTCNSHTQDHYSEFSCHIACESLNNDVVVPVINRRCLCELARQIGFTEQALGVFQLQQLLSTFRHVQADQAQRNRLARSLPISKLRFPFPHMASVVIKELNTGMLQLMSQGTGDIILDSCSDFWDGQDLAPLSELDRKKILDFYHRTSLTSYCTAFAYRPLTSEVSGTLSNAYLEIPSNNGRLYSSILSPSPPRCWVMQPLDNRGKVINRCQSSDSLLGYVPREKNLVDTAEACFEIQCNQVFIGMVAMQYQARMDMVHLIEQLDKACIRFVHFSKENELRSRVFSEKMGLESGWNCHISLLTQRTRSESGNSTKASKSSLNRKPPSVNDILNDGELHRSPKTKQSLELMRPLSYSAPSAINLDVSTVKFGDEISMHDVTANTETSSQLSGQDCIIISRGSHCAGNVPAPNSTEDDMGEDLTKALIDQQQQIDGQIDGVHLSRSPSHITESTEQSVPITFDMSNRAKLPKGINNIRPHLENVDNVPLLVSLFTDCTPDATCEMIKIMQEYGEVICCIGSSATYHNIPIFMQSDASISLEPLYPQLCVQQSACDTTSSSNCPLPMDISCQLNSLPCTLSFYRDDPISIYHLIMEARHFMMALRNCFHFLLASSLSVSVLILLSSILLLPPPLTLSHVLLFVLVSIPLLSVSLVGCPMDSKIMTLATGKNADIITRQALLSFVGYCAVQFGPSVVMCLLIFGLTLFALCQSIPEGVFCKPLLGNTNYTEPNKWNGWSDEHAYSLLVSQNLIALLFIVYLVLISASFVHQSYQFWKRNPFSNVLWCLVVVIVVFLHVVFFVLDTYLRSNPTPSPGLDALPLEVWIICSVWPICLLTVNELIKMHKIKVDVRNQKKARLEFGTKLGMNSPF